MIIDIVFLILMALAIYKGYQKGLILSIFSVLGYIIGLSAALKLSAVVAIYLQQKTSFGLSWLPLISFALVFAATVILVKYCGKLISQTFKMILLGWVNQLAGMILFVIIYTTVYSVLLFYLINMKMISEETVSISKTYLFIQPWGPKLINGIAFIIPIFQNIFEQLNLFFEKIAQNTKPV